MDRARLNLNDLLPLWEREIAHPLHEPPLYSLTRRDVDVLEAPIVEDVGGDRSALAQDIFGASVIRQGGLKRRF